MYAMDNLYYWTVMLSKDFREMTTMGGGDLGAKLHPRAQHSKGGTKVVFRKCVFDIYQQIL